MTIGPLYGSPTVVNYHPEISCFLPYIGLISTYPAVISHIVLSRMMQVCYSQLQSKICSLVTALISHSCLVKFNTLFQVIPSLFVSAPRLLFLLVMSWQNSYVPLHVPYQSISSDQSWLHGLLMQQSLLQFPYEPSTNVCLFLVMESFLIRGRAWPL